MARGLVRKNDAAERVVPDASDAGLCSLDIEIDEHDGILRIYDPRAFHAGRRAFCRRLLEAVADDAGLEKAEIDVVANSCRLQFDPRASTARSMAVAMTAAVRRAAANGSAADRLRWWSRPSQWSTLTGYRTPRGISWWETLDARPGRIQLRHGEVSGDRRRLSDLSETLATLEGVERSRVSPWSRSLTLDYRPDSPIAYGLLDAVEHALRDSMPAGTPDRQLATVHAMNGSDVVEVATGFRRLRYLALAGGAFALTLVGLVVPGIPTVPFLLATSYYLARSSPRLNDRLRRTAIFGSILVEWEEYHGLSPYSKVKLVGLTDAIIAVTVALSAGSPVVLMVLLVIAIVSAVGIARIPGLPDSAAVAQGPAPLALPSP